MQRLHICTHVLATRIGCVYRMFVAVAAAVAIGVAIVIVSGERNSEEVCALARCLVINWQISHTEFTCRSETRGARASQASTTQCTKPTTAKTFVESTQAKT